MRFNVLVGETDDDGHPVVGVGVGEPDQGGALSADLSHHLGAAGLEIGDQGGELIEPPGGVRVQALGALLPGRRRRTRRPCLAASNAFEASRAAEHCLGLCAFTAYATVCGPNIYIYTGLPDRRRFIEASALLRQ